MNDIETAIKELEGHSICLCKNGIFFTDDGRGISPMMRYITDEKDLRGYSAADVIVGKAAAMLFAKAGIVCVYGKVMSKSGKAFLDAHGIPNTCDTLTDKIINRSGTDICPMEKAVTDITDIDAGYEALKRRIEELKKESIK